ncbi:MAG: CPBP family intramembrane metalloprotease [Chloroflexi bacterium]|nr:CPBP family intramembrane metalloprotease [Chloroflexota bacterium]
MDIAAGAPFPPATPLPPEVSGRAIPWTPKDVLVGLLLFIGTFLVLPLPVALPLALLYEPDSRPFLIISIAVSVPIYLAIAGIAARMTFVKYRGGWIMLGVLPATRRTLGWALVAFVAALAVSFAYGWIIQIPGLEFLHQKCADQVPESIRSDRLLLAMSGVLAVLFAPVCEELYFRGFVFPGLARAWGPAAGIAASGILFGSAHMLGNPALYKSVIQFSAIGIVFAFAYWKSGNILSTILAHFTFNLMGIILIASTTCHD